MVTHLDLGNLVLVKRYITGIQLMTEKEISNTVRIFMVGVNDGFDIKYPTKELRNEGFANLKKMIIEK